MHSTQRNESTNNQIKRFIKSSLRTKFIRILDILKTIAQQTDRKVFIILYSDIDLTRFN